MGFLNKLFSSRGGSEESNKSISWKILDQMSQLDEIVEESKNKTVAIFKHSTRCGISRMALKRFEKSYNLEPAQLSLYYLDLLVHRDISNEIAHRFKVYHESPQMIVIKNGNSIYNASHYSIDAEYLEKLV